MERMADDPTARFFAELGKRTLRLPQDTHIKIRIELEHDSETDHWFIEYDGTRAHVSREGSGAQLTLRARKELFDRIVSGETNLQAALYRTELAFEGNLVYVAYFRASLPDQPGAIDPRVLARQAAGLKGTNGG